MAILDSFSLSWPWDAAPHAQIVVPNSNDLRGNYFSPHDRLEIYVGRGGTSPQPLFIGHIPANSPPRTNGQQINIDAEGYSARMSDLRIPTSTGLYAGWDAMIAIKDLFGGESNLNVDGLCGLPVFTPVPTATLGNGTSSRMEAIQKLLPFALDPTTPNEPIPYHWREIPNGAQASITQIAQLDYSVAAPAEAAVITYGTDNIDPLRRSWNSNFFNAALYTPSPGAPPLTYSSSGGNFAQVFSPTTYASYDEAVLAVQKANRLIPRYELSLTKLFLYLTPGDVIRLDGAGLSDKYMQIAEVLHSFHPKDARTTIRFAERLAVL